MLIASHRQSDVMENTGEFPRTYNDASRQEFHTCGELARARLLVPGYDEAEGDRGLLI